ncbi:MAG: hypothetical protein ACFFFG_16990 [Candidatus Thorarchaeota archaeon]
MKAYVRRKEYILSSFEVWSERDPRGEINGWSTGAPADPVAQQKHFIGGRENLVKNPRNAPFQGSRDFMGTPKCEI